MDILPDSRLVTPKHSINRRALGSWIPVYCANCGVDGGLVPEENMTFIFYLCSKCAETHGQIAGTMMMPDEVFFERVKQEQLEQYNRYLSPVEWEMLDESNPLMKLIKDRQVH